MLSIELLNKPGVVRFNGYSNELRGLLQESCRRGHVVDGGLQNPSTKQVQYLTEKGLGKFELSEGYTSEALSRCIGALSLNQRTKLAKAIVADIRTLNAAGKPECALGNYFTKLMCWLYYRLSAVLTQLKGDVVPIVVYVSKYSLYELHAMKVLADYGCCVLYIDSESTEQQYLSIDKTGVLSTLVECGNVSKFPAGWSLCNDIKAAESTKLWYDEAVLAQLKVDDSVGYVDLEEASGLLRLHVKGVFNDYENTLFTYTQSLHNSLFIAGPMLPVRPAEVVKCSSDVTTIEDLISNLYKESKLPTTVVKAYHTAFYKACKAQSVTKVQKCLMLYSLCMRYACLLPCGYLFVLNPMLGKNEEFVIDVLKNLQVNVVLLDTNKRVETPSGFRVEEYDTVMTLTQYPTGRKASSITTVASQAESDIRRVLYDDPTGLLRSDNVQSLATVRLDCTYEEILQLWDEPLRMRQGYELEDNVVKAPVIFAALNGVPEDDISRYARELRDLRENSLFATNTFFRGYLPSVNYAECTSNKRVSLDKILNLRDYKYGHLREEVQHHLISKMQEMLDLDIVKGFGRNGIENVMFQVMLTLPDDVIQALHNFNFTDRNPKLVVLRDSNEQLSLYDTIAINYMSLLGFDIVIIIPTGYNVLDKYSATRLYKKYDFGNYSYDFDIQLNRRKSFIDKLFRR